MSWDVVVRIRNSDNFAPKSQAEPVLGVSFDRPGDPFLARERVLDKISNVLGSVPGNTVCDLLHTAIAVYSADVLISRRYAADGWTRDINVYLPVTSLAVWQQAEPLLTKLLT